MNGQCWGVELGCLYHSCYTLYRWGLLEASGSPFFSLRKNELPGSPKDKRVEGLM